MMDLITEQSILIRHAVSNDINDLTDLINELGYQTTTGEMLSRFNNINDHPDYKTFVAVQNNVITGMAGAMKCISYEKNGQFIRILALVTGFPHRNKGIGRRLLIAVEKWAMEIAAGSVLLNCGNREERKSAHRFYEANGYTVKSSGYVKNI